MFNTRKALRVVVAAIGIAGSMVLAAPAASAETTAVMVSCSGTGCDGRDPVNSGCGASAVTSQQIATPKGTFYLKYSTVCRTNWVLVPNYAGGSSGTGGKLELYVEDADRGKFVTFFAPATAGRHYGNMVYSPGDNCAIGAADWIADSNWEVVLRSSGC